ncbi:O-antigen ligase family protein [Ruegeria intermedia]|uniref:O-antigen ligase family protein n=1 Tax=Ruegeria intermedia TaxID=996115 RepID=UPI00165FC4C5|nr:O-antigen ligase family protein [Ruegeria intermedia]
MILFAFALIPKGRLTSSFGTKALFVYFLVALISASWSSDISATLVSLTGFFGLLCATAFYEGKKFELDHIAGGFLVSSSLIIISSLILIPFSGLRLFDFLQGQWRFSGITFGAHSIARIGVFSIISALHLTRRGKIGIFWLIAVCSASLVVIYLSDSRQAYAGIFWVIFCIIYIFYSKSAVKKIVIIKLGLLALIALGLVMPNNLEEVFLIASRSGGLNEITTFTGRTYVWEAALDLINNQVFMGYGFGTGGFVLEGFYRSETSDWSTTSAHNMWLHASLDLGVVCATLFVIIIVWFSVRAWYYRSFFFMATTGFIVLIGVLERSLAGPLDYMIIIVVLSCSKSLVCQGSEVSSNTLQIRR